MRIAVVDWWVTLPFDGLLALPLALLLFLARSRLLLGVLLFNLSTCLPPFLIYSGRGVSYYGIYHLFAAAIILTLIVENAHWWLRHRRRGGSA